MSATVPTSDEFASLAKLVADLKTAQDSGATDVARAIVSLDKRITDLEADGPLPPVEPPPVVVPPPTGGVLVPAGKFSSSVSAAKAGDKLLLDGTYQSPFVIVKQNITIEEATAATAVLTVTGRPDILYHEIDGVVRGVTFQSQSGGFDDSQGAALAEVRSPSKAISLVWYDQCTFLGTAAMTAREQLAYLRDMGFNIAEVRFTKCLFDGKGTKGYGIHPYPGPSPKLVTVTDSKFINFPTNAAILNAASGGIVKVDRCSFDNVVAVARGMYGPVWVSNSWGKVAKPFYAGSNVVDKGGNDWTKAA